MNQIRIVGTEKEHVTFISQIERMCFAVPWSEQALRDDIITNVLSYYVTALYGEAVVGYGGMWTALYEAHITNIAVHPDYRRKGIVKRIVDALMDRCRQTHVLRITLEVRVSNQSARKLYEQFGFAIIGVRKRYYSDNGEDAFLMGKDIEPDAGSTQHV